MNSRIQLLWQLMVLNAISLLAGILLIRTGILQLLPSQVLILVHAVFAISFITGLIFLKGQDKDEKTRVFLTLVSVGTKFLLYLAFILLWLFLSKNLTKNFVIAFFVLYLVFTIYLVLFFYKTLKTN